MSLPQAQIGDVSDIGQWAYRQYGHGQEGTRNGCGLDAPSERAFVDFGEAWARRIIFLTSGFNL